jgi:hypothetical protein
VLNFGVALLAVALGCHQVPGAPERRAKDSAAQPGDAVWQDGERKDRNMAEQGPVITSESQVVKHYGQVCTVVGTYQVKTFYNKKNEKLRDWPVVVLKEGRRSVLIESLWNPSKAPSSETVAQYKGKRVEVVGVLHAAAPGSLQNMAVPCISPVESIRVLR